MIPSICCGPQRYFGTVQTGWTDIPLVLPFSVIAAGALRNHYSYHAEYQIRGFGCFRMRVKRIYILVCPVLTVTLTGTCQVETKLSFIASLLLGILSLYTGGYASTVLHGKTGRSERSAGLLRDTIQAG